jgi:hypothetical protein
MSKWRWVYWGTFFSVVLFFVLYFLIYKRVLENPSSVLMLGNMDVSGIGKFFSKIVNVVISSLVIGFLLGLSILIGSKKGEVQTV